MTTTIIKAETDEPTVMAVLDLLVNHMHPEVGRSLIDRERTLTGIFETFDQGIVFNAIGADGEIVGSLGAVPGPAAWYSAEVALMDRWFYVRPASRGFGVGAELLAAVRREAAARSMALYVAITDPRRAARDKEKIADLVGFVPVGHILRFGGS